MNGYINEATYDVAAWIHNDAGMYELVGMLLEECCEQFDNDSDRIDCITDHLEVEVRDNFISGTETPAGDAVLRNYLNQVHWSEIARTVYGDHLTYMEV